MAVVSLKTISESYPLLTQQHTLEPLWAGDTGRNSNSGKYSGTFIGYFSQLEIEFGSTSQNQMIQLRNWFDKPIIDVYYKDSETGDWKTEQFYGTSIKAKLNYWDGYYEPFSLTLTAISKRR